MARKKPEAIQALEALEASRPKCSSCDVDALFSAMTPEGLKNFCDACSREHHAARAADALKKAGLERRPDEPMPEWRKRMFKWFRENATVKRFGGSA